MPTLRTIEPVSVCYLLGSLRRDSSDEMESRPRGGAKFPSVFSTSWVDQISVDCNDMSCHDMFSDHEHPPHDLPKFRAVIPLNDKSRPVE